MRFLQGADPNFIQFIEQLYILLWLSWGIIIFIGNFIAVALIAIGFVSWLADWHPPKGKRLILGGLILFFVMQWMALSAPGLLSVLLP